MPAQRVILIHTLDHAKAALEAASEFNAPIALQSAPDAIFYAGSLYLLNMFKQAHAAYPTAQASFILDCADAGAEAVAALQMGHQSIRSSAAPQMRAKLADIAAQYGARLIDTPYEALDLQQVRDTKGACADWLRERTP